MKSLITTYSIFPAGNFFDWFRNTFWKYNLLIAMDGVYVKMFVQILVNEYNGKTCEA